MTDQPISGDELASAMLDDEIPRPDTVEAGLAERLGELRAASQAIAAPLPIDELARERAIAAALAEFDLPLETPTETPTATPIAGRRFKPALLGAAAAVIVLIGAAAVVIRDDDSPTTAASGAATTAAAEALAGASAATSTVAAPIAGGAGNSTVSAAADDAGAATEAAAPPAPNLTARSLGAVSDEDALRVALGPAAFVATKAPGTAAPTCEAEARTSSAADLGALTDNVTLSWKGQPARALAFVDPAGSRAIVVVADPTCEVLDLLG